MKHNTSYYVHRIALAKLKLKSWRLLVLVKVLILLANLVEFYLRRA
ncbi:hypothetical protein WDW86_01605 [Bdellovibrionota bacterium FG-2]